MTQVKTVLSITTVLCVLQIKGVIENNGIYRRKYKQDIVQTRQDRGTVIKEPGD